MNNNFRKLKFIGAVLLYAAAIVLFIVYLVKRQVVFMSAGAAFMCFGSVLLMNTNKKDKE